MVALAGVGGVGLVEEGVLPGKQRLHRALGGFGALLLASDLGPWRVAAVAASSPALWTRSAAAQLEFIGQHLA